jgi:hypothetical protein
MQPHDRVLHLSRAVLGLLLSLVSAPAWLAAQSTPMLQVLTIQVAPDGPLEFTFHDEGTGATNYVAQYSPVAGPDASWTDDPNAVITSLGAGSYQVVIADPIAPTAFYRIAGLGGVAGEIIINFATTAFRVTEGGAVAPTINFSAPFTGTLQYRISGSATAGDYASLSGEIQVQNSTSASIPIHLTDNESIGQLKNLILTLEPALGTRLGTQVQTVITIDENDARWVGTFLTSGNSLPFTLELVRAGGTTQGWLVGDAFEFFTSEPVPGVVTMTATSFAAAISDISMPADATLLNLPSILELELAASHGQGEEEVGEDFIRGHGTLTTVYPGHPHLDTLNVGTFLMQRPAIEPATNQVELVVSP